MTPEQEKKFYEWWTDQRDALGKQYVMMGPFALRNVAILAYQKGLEDSKNDTRTDQ